MPQLYYDLLFCSIFVIILTILAGFRKTVFHKDRAAYHRIVIGLFFFTGFSLVQLAGHQGLFSGIAYLGDTAGRKLVEATGIVGGLIFILSGIGAWLPSLVRGREDRRKVNKRYFCLKMITDALDRGKDLNETYGLILNCLSSYLGIERCSAYKYSSRRDMLFLAGSAGFEPGQGGQTDRIDITQSELKAMLNRPRSTVTTKEMLPEWSGSEKPNLVVPIVFENRVYGAYFCWTGDRFEIDDDFLDFMTVAGSLTGKHTHNHVIKVKHDYHHEQQTALTNLGEVCNQSSNVQEMIPGFFQTVRDLVEAEYLSVASLDNSGENMVRYTIGSSGRLLLEKGISRQTRGTDVFTVFEIGRPIIETEIRANDRSGEKDGLFLSCGMRSRLMCPVRSGKKVVGVLTLGQSQSGHFTRYHMNRIEGMTDLIAGVMQREQLNRSLEVKEENMLRLQLIQRQMLDGAATQSFFNDACEMLAKRMKCTVARISILDKNNNQMVSQACSTIRETGHELRENEPIPLSLLPWHRMTLDAQKLMLINQEDPESRMPPQESTSALVPNIKSAMLVPIMLNDEVGGIISIGESRNWNRRAFGATDLIFAKDMAAKCSLALRMKQLEVVADRSRDEVNRIALSYSDVTPELRTRMKSPLTSIIGAVELLRLKGTGDDFSSRYYNLILKSADRIKSMTEENYTDTESMVEEVGSEQVIG